MMHCLKFLNFSLFFSVCELQTFHAHVLGMDLSTNMINFALQAYECSKSSLVCMISINKKMGIN